MAKTKRPRIKPMQNEVRTPEERIIDLQRLGKLLKSGEKDSHQVFIWYAKTKGQYGIRISNCFREHGSTFAELAEKAEVAILCYAEEHLDILFNTVQEAIDHIEGMHEEQRKLLREIRSHESALKKLKEKALKMSFMMSSKDEEDEPKEENDVEEQD